MKQVFIITVNDDYGRSIFIECFDDYSKARVYIEENCF